LSDAGNSSAAFRFAFTDRQGIRVTTASFAEFKELVRSRTDIVALIGESVGLAPQRGGRVFTGLCPFHDDHNPSLQVNPERQSYKCWSCLEGGDCFSFVMKHENVSFVEALELLARRANLEPPKFSRRPGETAAEKSPLYDALQWAERQMHDYLLHAAQAERARRYLGQRGFTRDTIVKFRLGYHPEAADWLLQRAAGKFAPEQLEAARLVRKSDYGPGYYGEFRDRVVFPICDERGRTVAFGGRILPDSRLPQDAKYYNSRESAVFPKSRLVYGLNWAREGIRQAGFAVVVEGYADCVKLHQAGFGQALATLGTSLTETQVSVMKRFTPRIVLLYDGDEAGVRAARRAVRLFLAQDVDLRVLTLPDELDPDEFIEAHGAAALAERMEQAPEAWEFMYRLLTAEYGLDSTHARLQVLEGLLDLLAASSALEGSVREGLFLATLPRRLGMSEAEIRKRLADLRRDRRRAAARKVTATGAGGVTGEGGRKEAVLSLQRNCRGDDVLECEFFQILFTEPRMMELFREELGPEDFRNELLRELWIDCLDLAEEGELPAFERVLTRIDCPDLKSLVVWFDEQARLRDLRGKLAQDGTPARDSAFVGEIVRRMKLRREKASRTAFRLDGAPPAGGLDDTVKTLLQQVESFHKRRAVS
jgi:DNA primase